MVAGLNRYCSSLLPLVRSLYFYWHKRNQFWIVFANDMSLSGGCICRTAACFLSLMQAMKEFRERKGEIEVLKEDHRGSTKRERQRRGEGIIEDDTRSNRGTLGVYLFIYYLFYFLESGELEPLLCLLLCRYWEILVISSFISKKLTIIKPSCWGWSWEECYENFFKSSNSNYQFPDLFLAINFQSYYLTEGMTVDMHKTWPFSPF